MLIIKYQQELPTRVTNKNTNITFLCKSYHKCIFQGNPTTSIEIHSASFNQIVTYRFCRNKHLLPSEHNEMGIATLIGVNISSSCWKHTASVVRDITANRIQAIGDGFLCRIRSQFDAKLTGSLEFVYHMALAGHAPALVPVKNANSRLP